MNHFKAIRPSIIAIGFSLFFIAFLWLVLPNPRAKALDTHSVYYVAPSCAEVPTPCFTSIQTAVDAVDEPTDVIKVAAGTYTDVHVRPRNDISTTGVVTQVVYVIKTVTIRGGYAAANWNTPNPDTNLTTLDAQGKGRVLYITGNISVTIEGLRLTGGNSAGLGGRPGGYDGGGGVYVISATVTLSNNAVFSNAAYSGGGLWSYQSANHLANNRVYSNSASYCGGLRLYYATGQIEHNTVTTNTAISGGGVCLANSDQVTLAESTISLNTSSGDGGGLLLADSTVTLTENFISSNWATQPGVYDVAGGGIAVLSSTAILRDNILRGNKSDFGGGIYLNGSTVTLTENTIEMNFSYSGGGLAAKNSNSLLQRNRVLSNAVDSNSGGGLYFEAGSTTLIENDISGNFASFPYESYGYGGGVDVGGGNVASIIRNTISNNRAGDGGGLFLSGSDVSLEGNLIVNNSAGDEGGGLYTSEGSISLNHNLVISNSAQRWSGGGIAIRSERFTSNDDRVIGNSAGSGGGINASYWPPPASEVTLTNIIIAGNSAQREGSGLHIQGATVHLFNATIADNVGTDLTPTVFLGCMWAWENCLSARLVATNTIIANNALGISVTTGSTAILEATLWYSNAEDYTGTGTVVTGAHNFWGDPLFVNPEAGDYHIGPDSAAIDRGVPTSVATDIDNQPRSGIPDLGADEYWAPGALKQILLPIVFKH